MTASVLHQSQSAQTCRLGGWRVTTGYRNAVRHYSQHLSSVIAMKGEHARVLRKKCGRWELRVRRNRSSDLGEAWLTVGHVGNPKIALRLWLALLSEKDF